MLVSRPIQEIHAAAITVLVKGVIFA